VQKRQIYLEKTAPFLLILLILGLVLFGWVVPSIYQSLLQKELDRAKVKIEHVEAMMNQQMQVALSLVISMEDNTYLHPAYFTGNYTNTFNEIQKLLTANSTINGIYLYIRSDDLIIGSISAKSYDLWAGENIRPNGEELYGLITTLTRQVKLLGQTKICAKMQYSNLRDTTGISVITFLAPLPYYSDTPYGTAIIDMNPDVMRTMYQDLDEGMYFYIVDEDGETLFADQEDTELENSGYIKAALNAAMESPNETVVLGGKRYSIYLNFDDIADVYYLSLYDCQAAAASANMVRSAVLTVLIGMFAIVLVFVFLLVRNNVRQLFFLYNTITLSMQSSAKKLRPVRTTGAYHTIYTAVEDLKQQNRQASDLSSQFLLTMREVYLLRLLKGGFHDWAEAEDAMEASQIYLDGAPILLMILYNQNQNDSLYGVQALIDTLACDQLYLLHQNEEMLVVLTNTEAGKQKIHRMIDSFETKCGDTLIAWVNSAVECAQDLPDAYRKTMYQVEYSVFHQEYGLFYYPEDVIEPDREKSCATPINALIRALASHWPEKAQSALDRIKHFVKDYSITPAHARAAYVNAWQALRIYIANAENVVATETADGLCRSLQEMLDGINLKATAARPEFTREALIEYIDRHLLDSDLSIATISKHFRLSEPAFSLQFKQVMETGYLNYVNNHKIALAQELLMDDKHTIAQIAEMLRYSNASNFTRMFKNILGVTPGQYKRLVNGKKGK